MEPNNEEREDVEDNFEHLAPEGESESEEDAPATTAGPSGAQNFEEGGIESRRAVVGVESDDEEEEKDEDPDWEDQIESESDFDGEEEQPVRFAEVAREPQKEVEQFDVRSGLPSGKFMSAEDEVEYEVDIDAFQGMLKTKELNNAILAAQKIRVFWRGKSSSLSRRTVLWGCPGLPRGHQYNAVVIAELLDSHMSLRLTWRKGTDAESESGDSCITTDEVKRAYEQAMKEALVEILTDSAREAKFAFSSNINYLPDYPEMGAGHQDFDGREGLLILGEALTKLGHIVAVQRAGVDMRLLLDQFGQKVEAGWNSKQLDVWFDIGKFDWVAVATVFRKRASALFGTKEMCGVLRSGGGLLSRHSVAGLPLLNNVTWKKAKDGDVAAFAKDLTQEDSLLFELVKILMYNEFSHTFRSFEKGQIPFTGHQISSRMVAPTGADGMFRKKDGEMGRWVRQFEDLRNILVTMLRNMRQKTQGLRFEETLLILSEKLRNCEGRFTLTRLVSAAAEQEKKTFESLFSEKCVRCYSSDEVWRRALEFVEEWTNMFVKLCAYRNEHPGTGLTMPQIVTACILDSLLELLYTGREDAKVRALLSACDLQQAFDEGRPNLSVVHFSHSGAYIGANYDDVVPFVKYILSHGLEKAMDTRMKQRGEQVFEWKARMKNLFDHHRSCFQQEKHLLEFFVECGLPILYEDLARRLSRSKKDQLKKPLSGAEMRLLMRSESLADAVQQLAQKGFLTAGTPFQLFEDDLVVSAEQVGRAVVSGGLSKKSKMFGISHLFPVMITAAEDLRKRFEEESLGGRSVRENLGPYLAMAICEEKLVRFNRFSGDSPLVGNHFVSIVLRGPGDDDNGAHDEEVAAGPVSRRKFDDECHVGNAAELAEWVQGKIDEARDPVRCRADDLMWIERLCSLVFDPNVIGRPSTDRLKKAHVLCGLRHVLKFDPESCFLKLYKLYSGKKRWNIKERQLRAFWLQEFVINGTAQKLFTTRNTGNKQLRPIVQCPANFGDGGAHADSM